MRRTYASTSASFRIQMGSCSSLQPAMNGEKDSPIFFPFSVCVGACPCLFVWLPDRHRTRVRVAFLSESRICFGGFRVSCIQFPFEKVAEKEIVLFCFSSLLQLPHSNIHLLRGNGRKAAHFTPCFIFLGTSNYIVRDLSPKMVTIWLLGPLFEQPFETS